ncbi:glycoside hydrolase family 2 protein [Longitalea arenae]|uniref:glycoside hydrolase family 2 protein n=1 Tax=Longitalea arenae TaxID=2812558 RepID=UPI001967436C|nr:sugar-binding domain-containing protein [Longitalea arenae]
MLLNRTFFFLIIALLLTIHAKAQKGRLEKDLSKNYWNVWLDTAATWEQDSLCTPPVDISKLPVHEPTGGWRQLSRKQADSRIVHLPATVEEYYWGRNGNKFGLAGNYVGVSWFTTRIVIPASMRNKRIVLQFESVRFRAEVFVNRRLCGYDLIAGTPFEVDICKAVRAGSNEIAVRITDPNGNFDWRDSQNFMWGVYRTQPAHGFGGITGKVKLIATDHVYIEDIFVKNKPAITEIEIQVTTQNTGTNTVAGNYYLDIREAVSKKQVYQQVLGDRRVAPGQSTQTITVKLPAARLWSVDSPNLYIASVRWEGNGMSDSSTQRFGFRWFQVKDVAGDPQFYLNNKRIVIRTAISWGFWPENGITPSDELAKKQILDAKRLGLNMLNFHRSIGQRNVLDYADELGLLYFEEPGGNSYPENLFYPKNDLERKQTHFYLTARDEKFLRMIRRDRSHPSLVIYNMHNERGAQPQAVDRRQMMAGHRLDNSRIITYNSCNGNIKLNEPDPKFKLHLLPFDSSFHDYGWFDQHHAGGPGVYHDNLYIHPKQYAKYTDHKDEIIYYGEEGAIGTPPRLQLIRDAILKRGTNTGWESESYLKWYDAYDTFLKKNAFNNAFPNVDSLTRKMGNVAYYYQGRVIENVRINNTIDGYAVNGWESMKLENHSGIVDNYRNLKGDPELIAKYNQPLYVAVKLNRKVLSVGDTTTMDFFLVNEKNIRGKYCLDVTARTARGETIFQQTIPVEAEGGITYGQLLSAGNRLVAVAPGYTTITARLMKDQMTIATGQDELYAVQLNTTGIPVQGMIADTSGVLRNFFKSAKLPPFQNYRSGRPQGSVLLIGAFEPQQTGNPLVTDILEWVNNGNTLIVVNNVERWADHLAKKEVLDYRGSKELGKSWYGGNYFSKQHPLLAGLPQGTVFNWEFQCFATYNKNRLGLRLNTGESVVACVSDHKPEVYSALQIIPHGRGKIILCALDIFSCIKDIQLEKKAEGDGEHASMTTFNNSLKNSANIVGQQLLLNLLKY